MIDHRVILLVEDDEHDQELTLRALERSNIRNRVVIAENGIEALDYLFGEGQQRGPDGEPELPALILLDLKLPKVDGLEVLRRVRADPRTQLLPTVILTSSNEDKDRLAVYASGANSYVRKPVEFGAFADAVARLGLYWLLVNEPPPPERDPR